MTRRALVVEDEPDLALGLRLNLEAEGFEVEVAGDGDEAMLRVRGGRWDVVLLDLRLPKRDGTEVLREMREKGDRTPVICLTARAEERDRVLGLDLGADDYVTKPFSIAELLARVRAVLRRGTATGGGVLDLGRVRVDVDDRTARVDGRRVELTATEASIVRYLAERLGQSVEREQILRDLWGVPDAASTRTLDNHVARLRKKLERDASRPELIETVHGSGYRLRAPARGTGR
jgi:DNA-binding response OmpR family regulator